VNFSAYSYKNSCTRLPLPQQIYKPVSRNVPIFRKRIKLRPSNLERT